VGTIQFLWERKERDCILEVLKEKKEKKRIKVNFERRIFSKGIS